MKIAFGILGYWTTVEAASVVWADADNVLLSLLLIAYGSVRMVLDLMLDKG